MRNRLCEPTTNFPMLSSQQQPSPTNQDQAPPPDRFRPGDVWLSPRGVTFTVGDKIKTIGKSRQEIGLYSHTNNRLQWRGVTFVSGGRSDFQWKRLSWGGHQ